MDIANKLGKTCSALRQRASAKGWNRPTIMDKPAFLDEKDTNQNPEVSNRITSGIVLGMQVTDDNYHCIRKDHRYFPIYITARSN